MRKIIVCLLVIMQVHTGVWSQNPGETIDVFQKNTDGYTCFRIPAIVQSTKGTLLAFAEARKNSCSDTGNIDVVLKRSLDGGKTWSELLTVWDDGNNVCGNPVPVVDKVSGRILLVVCWNLGTDHEKDIIKGKSKDTRKVFVLSSDDDGVTWSKPKEITSGVKKENWTWYATGPCHGIQLQNKKYKNRLVVPANHIGSGTKEFHSQVIYSDDAGATWKLGGVVAKPGGNESSVVELKNGDLMLNMRNYNREESKSRAYAISKDGGETWSAMQYLAELIEPVCQGSTLNWTNKGKNSRKILFSNPASINKREKMTLKLSWDNGFHWPFFYTVYEGPCAYSDMVIVSDNQIGLLYEYGKKNPYEKIGFILIDKKKLR